MKIFNATSKRFAVDHVILCDHYFTRLKGLLGRAFLTPNEACVIKPCSQIHTVGMKFSIDVYFLNKRYQIIKIIKDMPPHRLSPFVFGSNIVIERMSGQDAVGIVGDFLELR